MYLGLCIHLQNNYFLFEVTIKLNKQNIFIIFSGADEIPKNLKTWL